MSPRRIDPARVAMSQSPGLSVGSMERPATSTRKGRSAVTPAAAAPAANNHARRIRSKRSWLPGAGG